MKSILRLGSATVVVLISVALLGAADDLDTFIQAQMALRQINGLSLAVIENGTIDARAYGVTSRGGPAVTTTTLFQAGSISKPVAALGALRLVEQGRLSLDEDVNAKLTAWRVPENEFTKVEKVTLRRLLSHSAGLTVHGFPGYDVTERMPSVPEVLDGNGNTAPVRVDVVPGTIGRYSGGGFTVMQQLVSDVTGMPFPQYMREAVLGPVGMSSSTYEQPLPPDRAMRTASGHNTDRSAISGRWHVYPEMAAAGLWTTPTDLARFAIEVQQSLAGTSNKVLSQAMTRQQLSVEKNDYGLGLALSGTGPARTFGHNGRDDGFDAMLHAYTESARGLVVMINANDNSRMMNRITEFVARKYNWPGRSTAATPADATPATSTLGLEPVTGRYELNNNNMLTLVSHGRSLYSAVDGLPDERFVFTGNDRFTSTERDVSFGLTRTPAGDVVGLAWKANGKERSIPRIGPLFSSITPVADPDPSVTQTVVSAIRGLREGPTAGTGLQQLTPGARTDLAGSGRAFDGFRGLTYMSAADVAGRHIERHGSVVNRVLFYRMDTEHGNRWLLIHLTSDRLITDYDIVDP